MLTSILLGYISRGMPSHLTPTKAETQLYSTIYSGTIQAHTLLPILQLQHGSVSFLRQMA